MSEPNDEDRAVADQIATLPLTDERQAYYALLVAAYRESGRYQTILVTHSREIQAMVERTIDVTSLGPAPSAAVEFALSA
jgi:hypothetical protein